ncbi:MAG: 4-hydroxybenzoate octaprenyltransferase [Sinobacteraceae bacterium]|nr:4-hydroxybenzoate octaprenyltransferase [Nevskiaceae bacterium]
MTALRRRLREYVLLTRLDRPIGILLLLWPVLWALWLASGGLPEPKLLVIFVLGTILTRSAGCIVNDLADRDFDPHVSRTHARPLAARRISPHEAVTLFVLLSLLAFALVWQLDARTIALSVIAIVLMLTYPLFKRFFPAPQAYLGIAFGWGVPMAYMATQGTIPFEGWLLFVAAVVWAVIYDTFYAMVDRPDDLKLGLKSSAILFGRADLAIIALCQCSMLGLLAAVGIGLNLGVFYFCGLIAAAVLFAKQLWGSRRREPAACFKAFLDNNYVGVTIFIGIALDTVQR